MPYIGTQPKDVRSFGRAKFDFTATQGQTAFTGADDDSKTLGFTDGQIEVYVNGILMDESDFTTSNGNTVTLVSAANLNDIISIVALQTDIPNSDYVPASGGTFSGNVAMSGTLGVTGAVTASNGLTVDDAGATPLTVDRATSDGDIIDVQKDGTSVGSIGTYSGDLTVGTGDTRVRFIDSLDCVVPVSDAIGTSRDNGVDLGFSSVRFKDLYLGGGVYLGGTAAGNKLEDVEEGSWTPNIYAGGSALPVNARYGYYRKVGSLLFLSFYWFHNGGLTSYTNTGTAYNVQGLPFTVVHLANSAYQFIKGGYQMFNGANAYEDHRWQANATNALTIYGPKMAVSHTSSSLEFSATGVLMTDD